MSSWVPALLASAVSAVVAIVVSYLGSRSERQLKWLDNELAEKSAENAARRSYQYEARKRLYSEVNPQFFQLREACELSSRRLRRIINGDIEIVPPRHVLTSTERLFAPLVLAQELQRHLTGVDLNLDRSVRAQYLVCRELLWTLHEGMVIAKVPPVIAYRPPEDRKERRQHLTVAEVQRLVDYLTVREADGSRRPMKQNELDDKQAEEGLGRATKPVSRLFDDASPVSRPVLWRLLLAQVALIHVFIEIADSSAGHVKVPVMPPDIGAYKNLRESQEHFDGQVEAARQYVEQRLKGLWG